MASIIENLIEMLKKEKESYEILVQHSKEKTNLIISNDIESIREKVQQEEKIIRNLSKMELQREEIVKDIASILKVHSKELKISDIIKILEKAPEEQKALQQAQEDISEVLKELQLLNEQNKKLLQQALDYIDFSINVISSSKSVTQNSYGSEGTEKYGGAGSQSYFDFKR